MMTPKLRVGQIGVGYWGPNVLRAVASHSEVVVTAICDASQRSLDQIVPNYPHAKTYSDIDQTLAAADVDAVIVALPAGMHYDVALKVLKSGKHCFVEKPLALSSRECEELIELAERNKRTLMVGHTFEYHSAVKKIKELINEGEVGQIYNIFCQRMNLGRIRQDIDAMWNLAPHDISIALYWLNHEMPVSVRAQGFSHLPRVKAIADQTYLTMEFKSGTVVHVISSWLSPEKVRKIMLVGSKRMVTYDDVNVDSMVQIYDKGVDIDGLGSAESYGEYQHLVRTGDVTIPNIRMIEPLRTEMHHFVNCIRTGEVPISSGRSGLNVTRILEAATQSMANNGVPVALESAS